jgi:predicted branched-subunit amino acid permease
MTAQQEVEPVPSTPRGRAGTHAVPRTAILAVTGAIGAFGVIYGAAAVPLLGRGPTIASSVLVFSGAAQFALLGLLGSGAGTAAILGTVGILALRHLPLGAVLRPRLRGTSDARRAGLAWFLIDETAGLALAQDPTDPRSVGAAHVLVIAGSAAYLAFFIGTVVGTLGTQLPGVEPAAAALFPVLFVGLAGVLCRTRSDALRAVAAASAVGLIVWASPGAAGLAPLIVAILVALPGGRS